MPPTTTGRRPAASAASISAWARSANSPAENVSLGSTNDEQPVLELGLLVRVAAPVRVSRPR